MNISGSRWLTAITVTLATGLVAFYAGSNPSLKVNAHQQSIEPSISPVKADFVESRYDSKGLLAKRIKRHYLRFSDHTIVNSSEELFPGSAPMVTEIMDTSSGKWIYLDPETKPSTSLKHTPGFMKSSVESLSTESCGDFDLNKALAEDMILGFKA